METPTSIRTWNLFTADERAELMDGVINGNDSLDLPMIIAVLKVIAAALEAQMPSSGKAMVDYLVRTCAAIVMQDPR